MQLSIISGRSSNAEEEEITFNTVKSITNNTSCYRPGHIISNIFIRLQAEKKLGRSENCVEKQESQVSRLAHSLPLQSNTRVPKELIKKHSRSWQAHLERISDFLLPGEGVWGCQDDEFVEFFDACSEPEFREEGPKLHHFRSTNFKNEEEYLMKCWQECVETEVIIPAHLIRTEDQDGNVEQIYTDYLNGPLFTEFTSLRPQNQSEPIEMPLQANDSSSTSENAG